MLKGKNIVLGVSGGIAVYKAVDLVSRLRKAGCNVDVIMTESATQFVTPLTFRELSCNPVTVSMWAETKHWNVEHIALATKADLFLIAPATANIIGKIANGIADDMLSTTVMATKAPVVLVPAMNSNMYQNPIVTENLAKLAGLGYHIMPPAYGWLACGTEGPGRMPEPSAIVDHVSELYKRCQERNLDFHHKRIIVTAGGTREAIDPVRYIGNRSSGKMGYAIAAAAAARGADVLLISGPTGLAKPDKVEIKYVESAMQMRDAVMEKFDDADIVVKAAAVADYRPRVVAEQKIKKSDDSLTLVLERNPDILRELGQLKRQQILVGFAAETQELVAHATEKLQKKNLDMIVANDVTLPGAGFNTDTNIVKLLYADRAVEELAQMPKSELANVLLDRICSLMRKKG